MFTLRKQRVIPFQGPVGGHLRTRVVDTYWGTVLQNSTQVADNLTNFNGLKGSQITETENHPSWRGRKSGLLKGDVGGPFFTERIWAESFDSSPRELYGELIDQQNFRKSSQTYFGPVLPMAPSLMAFPPPAVSSENSLNELGTIAIARCSPSNPTTDTTVFIKELVSEGIPHAFVNTLKSLRGMGGSSRRKALADAHLNTEFGWLPFVSDLRSTAKAIASASQIMAQFERDSGKVVRRSYYFPIVESAGFATVQTNASPWYNPSGGYISNPATTNKGRVVRTSTIKQKTWFKGAFTYYVPTEYGFTSRAGMAYAVIQARKIAGLSLTPDAIWNSMPWSWAVDWFTNTSEVLSNWSDWAVDNQVLRYGYIMQHTLQKYVYTFEGPSGFRSGGDVVPPVTLCRETKVRVRATPYGFGLDLNGLSNRKKAIVVSLGLSRGK